jgi:hypothetical protein
MLCFFGWPFVDLIVQVLGWDRLSFGYERFRRAVRGGHSSAGDIGAEYNFNIASISYTFYNWNYCTVIH